MGVLHGRDVFSSKYITAEIRDASSRLWFVPIKYTIGNYFLVKIEGKTYAFDIRGEQCIYRDTLVKSFRVIRYDTSHYKPISSSMEDLKIVLSKNDLPRVDSMLHDILVKLGKREKRDFESHNLEELIEDVAEYGNSKTAKILGQPKLFEEGARNIINFIDNLDVREIVTPVRRVSEYITDDIKACPSDFLGQAFNMQQIADIEHKKITNTPLTSKTPWMKMIAVIMMVGLIGAILYIGYSEGWFDGIASLASPIGDINFNVNPPPSIDPNSVAARYPTPEAAKAAIDAGQAKLTDFPPAMRGLISSVETPSTP